MMRALLLNGSPAQPSHTQALLLYLQKLLQQAGHEASILNLQELKLPANDPVFHERPDDHPDPTVRQLVEQVNQTDIVILGTPLYHGSFSGLLKTALDHLADDAFADKAIGIISNASSVRGSTQAAQHLVVIPRTMKGKVSNRLLGTGRSDYHEENGQFVLDSEEILQRAEIFINELLAIK